jgi:hypothetical protein
VCHWHIERVDRYYYMPSRNGYQWKEVTYWYNPVSLERKETVRSFDSYDFQDYRLPEWARGITEHRRIMDWN